MHELLLKRFDLCFELVLPQPGWQLCEKPVYRIVVPKRVKFILANTTAAWRLVPELKRERISAFISKG